MANITLEEAFKLGIEAHKAGSHIDAKYYYNVILQALPDHAGTNHNMGALNARLGKHKESISYFRKALESDSLVEVYWVSYFGALVDIGQLKDAKALIQKAKSEDFAVGLVKKLEGLLAAKDSFLKYNPPKEIINQLMRLYNEGKLGEVVNQGQVLLKKYPEAFIVWNILGAANKSLGRIEKASEAFKQVTELNLNYADGFNNFGVTLKEQGKFDEAIEAYKKAVSLKPDYAEAYSNMGILLKVQGKFDEAIEVSKKAISLKPDHAEAYFNIADIFQVQGKLNEAIEAYKKSILLEPDYSAAYINLGNILQKQGKLDEAIEAFRKALSIKPDYAEAYFSIANSLVGQGKSDESIELYKKAIFYKPNYAEAYLNMGNIFQRLGKLDEAIDASSKALSLKPNYPQAYLNIGAALQDQAMTKESIESYKKALSIKPDYADIYWNLSSTVSSLQESKEFLEQCLVADPNYFRAKSTLSALKFYEGDEADFYSLKQSNFKNHSRIRSFEWVFNLPKLPQLYFNRWDFFDQMIKLSHQDRPFYEFGVWRGEAFKYLIKTYKKGYGFDTFDGLPIDWHNEKAGSYSSNGIIPKVSGGEFIVGKFEDTLPKFFSETRPVASVINFDADLYSSTLCALNYSKPVIDKSTVLIFDEFIMNENWEQDEYRALNEFCLNNNYEYEVLAVSFFTKQTAVRLIYI